MNRKPLVLLLAALLSVMLHGDGLAGGLDANDLTLQAMCQHGLTESAILYALAERNRVRERDDEYARWTQRLIECEAQAALRADAAVDVHWKRCQEIFDEYKHERAQDRRLPWLEWQAIRCDLLLAQDRLARWLAAPANGPMREKVLELVRTILSDLSKLEDDLKQRQPMAAKLSANDRSQAPAEQISQLRLDTVLMRCEAFLIRARLYESRSRDRVGAAANVEAEAGGLLDRTPKEWPTRASLEVARATAWLDLDREAEAIVLLQSVVLDADDVSARIRAAVTASEALIGQGQASQARAFVDRLKDLEGGPEWELAEIRLSLSDLSRFPAEKKEAEIAKLLARANAIRVRYGDYWRARVDSILASSVSSSEVTSNNSIELVAVEVRQFLAAGDEQAAIAKLISTSRNELATGRHDNAVRFATQASALLQRQQAWLAAADAMEEVAKQSPEIEGAAAGHLSAAWSLSQALKSNPQDKQLRLRYVAVLQDHIRLWPAAATTEQATQWLYGWLSASGSQAELLPVYRQQAERAVAPEKAREAIYTWLGIVLGLPTKRESELVIVKQALADGKFKSIDATVQVALVVATVIPNWSDAKATKGLQAEVNTLANVASVAIDRQLLTAVYWLLAARSGDTVVSKNTAGGWSSTELTAELVEPIAVAMVDAVDAWPTHELPAWAANIRFTEEQLQSLSQSTRLTSQAIAWRLRGMQPDKVSETLTGLRALCKQNAKLGALQLHLSHLLAKQDAMARRESTEIARRLAANSPVASDLYYAARWRLIRNQMLDGKNVEAQKAAKLVLATLAEDSANWRVRFGMLVKP